MSDKVTDQENSLTEKFRDEGVALLDNTRRQIEPYLPARLKTVLQYPYRRVVDSIATGVTTVRFEGLTADFKSTNAKTRRVMMLDKEGPILRDITDELEPSDVFYDVGANIGVYTCLLGNEMTHEGDVVAFEPHPKNADTLRENIELNSSPADVYDVALSDSDGEVEFAMRDERTGATHNTLIPDEADRDAKVEEVGGATTYVDMMTLDELRERDDLAAPSILKVDVEGAEYNVLAGAEETLRTGDCRIVYTECHPRHLPDFGATVDDIKSLLKDAGFTIELLHDYRSEDKPNRAFFLKAVRDT